MPWQTNKDSFLKAAVSEEACWSAGCHFFSALSCLGYRLSSAGVGVSPVT